MGLWRPVDTRGGGREVLSSAAWLLANTTRLVVASGIANIYARDALAAASAQKGLNEQSGGRFLLGLGVSHAPLVKDLRQHEYGKPVATMRAYLQAMAAAPYKSIPPPSPPQTVLAALGPKMLELAGGAGGRCPSLQCDTRTHPGGSLHIRQGQAPVCRIGRDPGDRRFAGTRARPQISRSLHGSAQLCEQLARLGFADADFAGGGSDRLIDAVIAWGDEKAIRARLDEHRQAGADHVCIQPIGGTTCPMSGC